MSSAGEKVKYYRELICKNQQALLNTKDPGDKKILAGQIEGFARLRRRYLTIHNKQILKRNQLQLFK